jgi:hypothetical protein
MRARRITANLLGGCFCAGVFLLADRTTLGADNTPPSRPIVSDDGRYTTSSTNLYASWKSVDTQSGIVEYQYLIRRKSTSGKIVVQWTSVGSATEITRTDLDLTNGQSYFIGVRAKNGSGLWSSVGYSDGIKVDHTTPSTPLQLIEGSSSNDADVDTEGQYTVSWSAASDSESGIAAYELQEQVAGTAGWVTLAVTTARSHSVKARLDNTKYLYRVRAQNGAGIWSGHVHSDGITVQINPTEQPPTSYQGFGAQTPAGKGQPFYRVTNLRDVGPGSLRDAVSQGNRTVVFDVAGEIELASTISVAGAFVTVDGFTAPSPGVTLKKYGLSISGERGAHDVIVRGIRIREAGSSSDREASDGIHIIKGAYNVVIDHVSIHGSEDGNLDITDAHDVTVSWSIFAQPAGAGKTMLIKYKPSRVTLHHNLFVKGLQRNPHVRIDDSDSAATDTTLDMRNNLIWEWSGGYGTEIRYGPWANIVDNFYSNIGFSSNDKKQAIIVCRDAGQCDGNSRYPARAYVAGNFSNDGFTDHINGQGTEIAPFPAPALDTTDARTACKQVLGDAGVRPLDAIDRHYLSLVSCPQQ